MRKIIFDIETKNTFQEVGANDPKALDISLLVIYDYKDNQYKTFMEKDFGDLWKILEQTDMLIGYNSDYFDIPLLDKYYPGDLTTIKSLDLLKEIKAVVGRSLRLDIIAEATLGTQKSGNGLDAVTWWKEGKIDQIAKYCQDDVKITKDVYEYALKNNLLKYKDMLDIRDIPLDTSTWEEKATTSMNYTLGI